VIGLAPMELLRNADVLLTDPPAALAGRWPTSVAVLLRQALERALAQLWQAKAPELDNAPYRSQLLCLDHYVHADVARRASQTWYELSAACHHHAYELPPTAAELGRWFEATEELVREVGRVANPKAARKAP
jgi:hypothetical protein